jgi:hypothetical protein
MALGAARSGVIAMVMRGAMIQTALGLAIGIPASLLCVRFVESQLFEHEGHGYKRVTDGHCHAGNRRVSRRSDSCTPGRLNRSCARVAE